MNKDYYFKICGYYLHFISPYLVGVINEHLRDSHKTKSDTAILLVNGEGNATVKDLGPLSTEELSVVRKFIKANFQDMYQRWEEENEYRNREKKGKEVSFHLFDSKRQERLEAAYKAATASKEASIKFLIEAGILLPNGEMAPHLR